jgi:hypothetical protein
VAQQVRSIRLFEIYNYGPWDNPQLGLYGFGPAQLTHIAAGLLR